MKARIAAAFVLALLPAAALAPPAGAGEGGRGLHRPLDLPELEAGEACPVSPVDRRVDWDRINIFGRYGTGPGPVYPGIGASDPPGHVIMSGEDLPDGWFGTKVFWYVKPSYRGPALLRGLRLDGPGSVGFLARRNRVSLELRIGRDDGVDWGGRPRGSRGQPSGVLARSPGCYGVQIDGRPFSRTVVFTVSTE